MRSHRWFLTVLAALIALTFGSAAEAGQKKTFTIGISFQQLRDPYFISIVYGATLAAKERDARLVIHEAGGYQYVDRQISQIEDLIQRRVDAIIVMPTNAEGVAPVVERAIASGIPAMHMGSRVKSDKMFAFVQSDDAELGATQARYLAKALNEKGNVAYLAGPAGVFWTIDRWKGFESAIKQHSAIKVLNVYWINSTREAGLKTMEDMLQAYPQLNAVGSSGDFMATGAADALKAARKSGKVLLTTVNLQKDTEDMVRDGAIQMTAAQQTVLIGKNAVQTALRYLSKEPYDKHIVIPPISVAKEDLGKIDLGPIRAPDDFKPKLVYP